MDSSLAGIRWQDIVDVTLNSYILFRLYILFRGTIVFRVLIGIASLLFIERLAALLGLIVTSWFIQGITAAAALIIVVVFRNEIRTILQARNLRSILWGMPHRAETAPVETLTESVFELARRRIGAILVVPGREDLRGVIQGGLTWRGLISREMILTIFWQGNPVHDGAAIVQGNRIGTVGAILPLTQRVDLPSHLGTRHRAAVGLTETSDALAIVVSEERGSVQLAMGGELQEIGDPGRLTAVLHEHLGLRTGEHRLRRQERIKLFAAASVSLLLVTAVWFSVSRGLDSLTSLDVPVVYANRDTRMEILEASSNSVRLNLAGSGALLRSLRPEQVNVRIDLKWALAGKNRFVLTSDNVSLPPGVSLRSCEPAAIEVTLDATVTKELPVQVDWVGKLPVHLSMTEARCDPQRVTVIGSRKTLEAVTTLYTEGVALERLERSGALTVTLALYPAALRLEGGTNPAITVYYTLRERPARRNNGT
jgi:uncharacterized protein (TIGR00159 family)